MTTRRTEIHLNGRQVDEWQRAEAQAEAERSAASASAIRGALYALAIEFLVGLLFGLVVVGWFIATR